METKVTWVSIHAYMCEPPRENTKFKKKNLKWISYLSMFITIIFNNVQVVFMDPKNITTVKLKLSEKADYVTLGQTDTETLIGYWKWEEFVIR